MHTENNTSFVSARSDCSGSTLHELDADPMGSLYRDRRGLTACSAAPVAPENVWNRPSPVTRSRPTGSENTRISGYPEHRFADRVSGGRDRPALDATRQH